MNQNSSTFEMLLPLVTIIVILIILFAVFRLLWGPRASSWLNSSGEEKIGLSKNKLYNANGYVVSVIKYFTVHDHTPHTHSFPPILC
jgi:hypothetical protein